MSFYFWSKLVPLPVLLVGLLRAGATMATPLGVSFALTDVQFTYDPVSADLSATAGTVGTSPAMPLPNNGIYKETLAGNYSVLLNLPPLDQPELWHVDYLLTFDGHPLFGNTYTTETPISIDAAYNYLLSIAPAPGLIKLVIAVLENRSMLNTGGVLDYVYNFAPDDRDIGTFALGSDRDLASVLGVTPLDKPRSATLALSIDVDAVAAPEPASFLVLATALLGLATACARRD